MDPGPGKSVGINLDPATGNMTVAWSADQSTLSWMVLMGPADNRVLVGTNILANVTNPVDWQSGPVGANYVEQIVCREAQTTSAPCLPDSRFGQDMEESFMKDSTMVTSWL